MEALPRKEDKIFAIIDRVLNQVFGKAATELIYEYLKRRHSLNREEFSDRIDDFAKGLEEFLSSGAYMIEHRILTDIRSCYGLDCSLNSSSTVSEPYDFAGQMRTVLQNA